MATCSGSSFSFFHTPSFSKTCAVFAMNPRLRRRGEIGNAGRVGNVTPTSTGSLDPRSQTPVWERSFAKLLFRVGINRGGGMPVPNRHGRETGVSRMSVPKQEFGNEEPKPSFARPFCCAKWFDVLALTRRQWPPL